MRLLLPCTLAVLLAQSPAGRLPPRDDGLTAFATGDYANAARILGPLADDSEHPDAVAAFLLATMYESGRGVERNLMRACGLFLKAASAGGPFGDQAVQLSRSLREELGRASEFCSADAKWRPLPQASFTLGVEHTVTFGSDAILVRYRGQEGRMGIGALPDSLTLPPIYIPLDVTRPQRGRRHFMQSFTWWRAAGSEWKLGWMLSEVVAAEILPVTGNPNLMTSEAAQPPDVIDFTALVRVRLSNDGEAEWAILGGPNPRSETVPWREPR